MPKPPVGADLDLDADTTDAGAGRVDDLLDHPGVGRLLAGEHHEPAPLFVGGGTTLWRRRVFHLVGREATS